MTCEPIGYEALGRQRFPLLARWLAEPLVARWWNHEPSPAAVERDFGPSVDGDDIAEYFLATVDGQPFGLIQRYPIAAYPEYVEEFASVCPFPPKAMSVDYLIGEPAFRGRGYGTEMIRTFVAKTWVDHPESHDIVVPVHEDNVRSWRALEGAGFRRIARGDMEPDNPEDSRRHVVYRKGRDGSPAR